MAWFPSIRTFTRLSQYFQPDSFEICTECLYHHRHHLYWKWRKIVKYYGNRSHFKFWLFLIVYAIKSIFLFNSFETCTDCLYHHRHQPCWNRRNSIEHYGKRNHFKFWLFFFSRLRDKVHIFSSPEPKAQGELWWSPTVRRRRPSVRPSVHNL